MEINEWGMKNANFYRSSSYVRYNTHKQWVLQPSLSLPLITRQQGLCNSV